MTDNMTYGRILYDNALRAPGAVVSLSLITEIAGFPKEYSYDWKDWTSFRIQTVGLTPMLILTNPNNFRVDSFAWFIKDPGDVAGAGTHTILVVGRWPGPIVAILAPIDLYTDGLVGIKSFPSTLFAAPAQLEFWVAAPNFALNPWDVRQWVVGQKLDFPIGQHVGIGPPKFQKQIRATNNIANAGSILGRDAVRANKSGDIDLQPVAESFVSAGWVPFLEHAALRPFFYQWDRDGHAEDTVLAAATELPAPANITPPPFMAVRLPWVGLNE